MNEEVIENLSLHLAFEGYDNDFIYHLVYELGFDKETQHYDLESMKNYSKVYKEIDSTTKTEHVDKTVIVLDIYRNPYSDDVVSADGISAIIDFYSNNFGEVIPYDIPGFLGLEQKSFPFYKNNNNYQMTFVCKKS